MARKPEEVFDAEPTVESIVDPDPEAQAAASPEVSTVPPEAPVEAAPADPEAVPEVPKVTIKLHPDFDHQGYDVNLQIPSHEDITLPQDGSEVVVEGVTADLLDSSPAVEVVE